jgi:hypothetical protein
MLIHRLVESEKNNKVSEGKDGLIRKQKEIRSKLGHRIIVITTRRRRDLEDGVR